ncbi:hypothetical protein [uncultured Thermomonospora sp.]|uniref:hypothetical protein n=1 Tax=uncultured Thermomonospora sp. TaxID=671175 RepID=UPI00259BEFEB|nr:hypothetical protein [uncultured Thermomonospora sp.]
MKSLLRRARRAGALAAVALLALPAAPAHAEPAIRLDRTTVKVGQTLTVRLVGWPAGNVLVELCGNEGLRGTVDCAVASSASTYVQEGRTATVMLSVGKPPIGCPCVVSVRPVSGGTARTVPIKVSGVPTLSEAERRTATAAGSSRKLTATKVTVTGGGPGEAWFGGTAHRTLRVTLRNEGTATLTDPPLSLTVGRGPEPTEPITAPALGTLAPGQERTYAIPFSVGAPAFGRYTVRGEITGLDEPISFTAHTSSYPWALPVLAALVLPLTGLTARRGKHALRRPPAALTATGLPPRTMNQAVAANVAWWSQTRNLSPEQVASSLGSLTGRPRTPADLDPANPSCSLDADDLLALSRILDVPLPALLFTTSAPDLPGDASAPAAASEQTQRLPKVQKGQPVQQPEKTSP